MKTNIALKLDSDLLCQIKILAAEQGISVSTMLREQLKQIVLARQKFVRERKRALARLRRGINLHWSPSISRDKLHDR